MEKLLDAARRTGAEAIHPGYGFLAENADFAALVEGSELAWVGPPAEAIAAMGNKTEARRRMEEAGVPVIPGTDRAMDDVEAALSAAAEIGYPVMLKAAAGGGGKGMRVVREEEEMRSSFQGATSEAEQAFGDGRVYLERFLDRPRHIEIQVLADAAGRTVHLGERECSIQRRHQKLVEEAPSPVLDRETREEMGEVAVAAAEAVGYRSAGTVEFLWEGGEYFFLEMNTRIQVEHPVTELVTGVDLVQEQLRIAAGEELGWDPSPDWPRGHAIECRISGEDPSSGFLPATGRVRSLRVPSGPGVRWDGGIEAGFEVGLHYDPLLAKLVVHGPDRESAIRRMRRALGELQITGVATTQPFHLRVMGEEDFRAGDLSIRYVEEHPEVTGGELPEEWARAASVAAALLEEERRGAVRPDTGDGASGGEAGGRSAWQRAFDPR
jgi:acetyl-CoA carboxylase biotin carboxylase subunit